MRTKLVYEWTVETVDSNGDVIDVDQAASASALLAVERWLGEAPEGQRYRLVLVRNEYESFGRNVLGGLVDRSWAYFKTSADGYTLPDCFGGPNGYNDECFVEYPMERVPKRCHADLKRAVNHARKSCCKPSTKTEVGDVVVLNELPDAARWEVIDVEEGETGMFLVREEGTNYATQQIHYSQIYKHVTPKAK